MVTEPEVVMSSQFAPKHIAIALIASTLASGGALAQAATPAAKDCPSTTERKSPTPSETGPRSGTAPGNAGSSGWSGGMGGTHTDTTPSGTLPGSGQYQPPTAEGLDLKKPTGDAEKRC